jgi:Zn-dependent peptidase ImmA (M78 family)
MVLDSFDAGIQSIAIRARGRRVVGTNTNLDSCAQRFAAAHALGHIVLLHQGEAFADQMVNRFDPQQLEQAVQVEAEATQFAFALLTPAALVMEQARLLWAAEGDMPLLEMVEALAKTFQVSLTAMRFRLVDLGIALP